jgi:TetR/AcrR family transcriptional repressor of mexJK operon
MKTIKPQGKTRAEIKSHAIIEAAKAVFLKKGFRASSMDEIAQQANVSKKTIYGHFKNKEELFEYILSAHWNTLLQTQEGLFRENKSVAENLSFFAKNFFNFLYQQDTIDLFRLLIAESNQFPNLADKILISEKAPFTRALIEFLEKCKKQKILNIKNSERAAAYFMGLLKEPHFWPMMLGFAQKKNSDDKNTIMKEAIALFLKAVSPE